MTKPKTCLHIVWNSPAVKPNKKRKTKLQGFSTPRIYNKKLKILCYAKPKVTSCLHFSKTTDDPKADIYNSFPSLQLF